MKRRTFIKKAALTSLGGLAGGMLTSCSDLLSEKTALALNTPIPEQFPFKISLAQWSLHRAFWSGKLKPLDFAQYTRETFNIDAVEYVNQFFSDKAKDQAFLQELKKRSDDHGITNVLIMIDMEGSLGTLDESKRQKAVDNHYKWIDAAKFLGCHSIRVNAAGKGERTAVAAAAVESLGRLSEYGQMADVGVVVENHGGYSGDAQWLTGVIQQVNNPYCGTLPDFGNFYINLFPPQNYDRYKGVEELLPFAKGVSAKTFEFNQAGQDVRTDYKRMMEIIQKSTYRGYIGIEYEGYKLSEEAGIKATKDLIIKSVS